RQAHRRRNRQMGQGDQVRGHQGGVIPLNADHEQGGRCMQFRRRQVLKLAAGAAAAATLPQRARALDYPTRPIHFVVGFAAGTGLDITARLIGQAMSDHLGQTVVIDNRPGAGTNIATESVVNAAPDGYTILMVSTGSYTNGALYPSLKFDFVRDIAPVASVTRGAFGLLVNPDFPTKTIPEFIPL